ncbi:MAG: gamma carbonic anhydrase family protein [Chloroflexi bacterium]|nr:gamma carbonic anhydrase family protein [Chloroflexota bacterium]
MELPFEGIRPRVAADAFIAGGAILIGDVAVGTGASIWFNAVARGDIAPIRIGDCTNVQDHCTVHVDAGLPAIIGDYVTVGHGAIVHGARVEDNVLIGMHATVLSGATIGANSIIGAGALVTENTRIPAGSLVLGVPGKVVRATTSEEHERIRASALGYVALSRRYRA